MEGVGLAVCVAVLEGVGVRVLDLVRVAVRELLGEGEPVLLPLLLGVGRWDGVGNAVRVVESVGDGEPENVSLGVTVLVAASVGKAVRVGESEGTGAPEHVGVPVEAAVPLADPVGLDGGVPAGEVDGVGLAAHEPEEHPPSVPSVWLFGPRGCGRKRLARVTLVYVEIGLLECKVDIASKRAGAGVADPARATGSAIQIKRPRRRGYDGHAQLTGVGGAHVPSVVLHTVNGAGGLPEHCAHGKKKQYRCGPPDCQCGIRHYGVHGQGSVAGASSTRLN